MKKFILKSRNFALVLLMIAGSLYIISCQTEEISTATEDVISTTDLTESQKIQGIPFDPDFSPPNIPNPPTIDAHCVVRLAYLSYLERCPTNASDVTYWINILNTRGFDDLAKGFITSPEASQRWNSRYQSFLSRNNITSYQIHKKIYIAYRGLLLREPDVPGGIYWNNILNTRGILDVANGIGNSPEFGRRLSGITTECNNAANQCTF
ncbi:hypothetical protein IMCC3317_31370 [Kordia antarctica]|uniref:DUF4214 domain-containing protein n=1 Tax=Kordia antarctica TaxID=1218801 RepID=A0A7L4ZNI6_9FLAO|nr:hypothetical protein [Kordia antarctica]QHI37756.1 hypothetical protein IMCC3317_31370 [Kordia antarctica]